MPIPGCDRTMDSYGVERRWQIDPLDKSDYYPITIGVRL